MTPLDRAAQVPVAPRHRTRRAAPRRAARTIRLLLAAADGWTPLLLVGLIASAVLLVLARYPIGQNSDGLIQTIFSLQKMTMFYWGQDRFANLLPFLAMPIADPQANAVSQLVLRTALGLLAPLFFLVLATRNAGAAWRATLAASALLLAFAPQRMIHETFVEASPYGTSLALAGFALLLFLRAARTAGGRRRTALRATGLALTCAAYMVNVSLALVAAPLLAGEIVLFGSALAVEFAFASAFAGAVTWTAMALFGSGDPTLRGFAETTVGLIHFGRQMLGKPGFFPWGVLLASATVLLLLRFRWRDPRVGAHLGHGVVLVAAFVASAAVLSLSTWVVMNHLHPRYLVPQYLLAASLGGLTLLNLVRGTVRGRAGRNAVLLGACACLLLVAAGRTPPPGEAPGGIADPARRPVSDAVAAVVLERSLDGIAGSYWDVWPAVFRAEQFAHDLGRPPGQVFGLTYRGQARRDAFAVRLIAKGRLDVACIGEEPLACNARVVATMTPPGTVPRVAGEPVALPDGRALTFLRIERARPAVP